MFSVQDINLLCAVGYADVFDVTEWRGRPKLEALVAFHAERPAVKATVRPEGVRPIIP